MRDPMSWAFPIGRFFGITVKVHFLLVIVLLGMYLRVAGSDDFKAYTGASTEMLAMLGILFLSVLLHEFGHCYGAHLAEGEAHEILLWPLGGLAYVDVPHTPRANFIATAMGPAVNLVLCVIAGGILAYAAIVPPFNPVWDIFNAPLYHWADGVTLINGRYPHNAVIPALNEAVSAVTNRSAGAVRYAHVLWWQLLAARVFYLNWFLFLLNVCVLAYPLDGGRMLQAALWPHLGYRRSTMVTVRVGFFFMLGIVIYSIAANEVLALCLALLIFQACWRQYVILETGGEESLFGYDFSQGYTSLEKSDEPQPRKRRPNALQRWLQQRAARKLQREKAEQEAEEHRMDELLQKIQREGKDTLTDEEQRFLKRVSDRYKNRK